MVRKSKHTTVLHMLWPKQKKKHLTAEIWALSFRDQSNKYSWGIDTSPKYRFCNVLSCRGVVTKAGPRLVWKFRQCLALWAVLVPELSLCGRPTAHGKLLGWGFHRAYSSGIAPSLPLFPDLIKRCSLWNLSGRLGNSLSDELGAVRPGYFPFQEEEAAEHSGLEIAKICYALWSLFFFFFFFWFGTLGKCSLILSILIFNMQIIHN